MPSIAPTALPTTPPVKQIRKRFDSSSSAQTTAPQKAEPKASRNSTKLIISAGSVAFSKDGFSLSFAAFLKKQDSSPIKHKKESVSALSFIV